MRADDRSFAPRVLRLTLALGAFYWGVTFFTGSILWWLAGTDPIDSASSRIIADIGGAIAAFAVSTLLYRARNLGLFWLASLCFALSMIVAPTLALVDFQVHKWRVAPQEITFDWTMFGTVTMSWGGTIFGWCCLFVAMVYNLQAREQERRLAFSREEAMIAQMRALRYQVNPHFLFNTLNSVAALVEDGAKDRALAMILTLSDFLHETLCLDPMTDVRLAGELALQAQYLEIERERFPDRITVTIAVPPGLEDALVPSLILQPLIENAVKHGIAAGPGRIEILVAAEHAADRLRLVVENDVPIEAAAVPGMGIGLKNVAARLTARFGARGTCEAGLTQLGRYRVTLELPLRTI